MWLRMLGFFWDWKMSLLSNCLYALSSSVTVWLLQRLWIRITAPKAKPELINYGFEFSALPPSPAATTSPSPPPPPPPPQAAAAATKSKAARDACCLFALILLPVVACTLLAVMYADWSHALVAAKVRMRRDHEAAALPHADCQRQPWFATTEQCQKYKFDFELKPDLIESLAFHEAWNHTRTHIRETFESVFIVHRCVVLVDSALGLFIVLLESLQHSTIGLMLAGAFALLVSMAYITLGPVRSVATLEAYFRQRQATAPVKSMYHHEPVAQKPYDTQPPKNDHGFLEEFPPDAQYVQMQQTNPFVSLPPAVMRP